MHLGLRGVCTAWPRLLPLTLPSPSFSSGSPAYGLRIPPLRRGAGAAAACGAAAAARGLEVTKQRRRGPGAAVRPGCDKLDRFLSKAGVLSRQEAKFAVRRGSVRVNGQRVRDPWELVQVGVDRVEVDGVGEVRLPDWQAKPPSVVIYNKPQDVVVTLRSDDPTLQGRQRPLHQSLPLPWRNLMAPHVPALRPVGRLDALSVGLLLLTDSSGLAATLMGPGGCEKEYLLRVRPRPDEASLARLRAGVEIRDGNLARGPTLPCEIVVVQSDAESAVLRFVIQEGRNRQLRRMCAAVGLTVEWLMRVRMGPVALGKLPLGEAREATEEEVAALLSISGT